tara:strand:- start:698 stop:949 length:252 start_codon:yes stop_codon:yes gene_type:complete
MAGFMLLCEMSARQRSCLALAAAARNTGWTSEVELEGREEITGADGHWESWTLERKFPLLKLIPWFGDRGAPDTRLRAAPPRA